MDTVFLQAMNEIVETIEDADYDPREQIMGYLQTGKIFYIARQNGAREKINQLDKRQIHEFLHTML